MSLQLKRDILQAQQESVPQAEAALKQTCPGLALTWDIHWDSFTDEQAVQGLRNILESLTYIADKICRDDLGKQAFATAIKKVVIRNVPAAEQKATLNQGTLELAGEWGGSWTYPSDDAITSLLENAL